MFFRALCKLHKTVWIVIFYYVIYSLFSFALISEPPVTFVSEAHRAGGRYVLMFVVGPPQPVFTDVDGAAALARRCGPCFITNNKGFLPITEYDAVLLFGKRNLLSEAEAAMEPGKRYLLETSSKCIKNKFRGCTREPRVTSFATQESYTLCGLCERMAREKYEPKKD